MSTDTHRWDRENSDRVLARQRQRYAENPEPRKASNRAQYAKYKEQRKARERERKAANPELKRARDRAYGAVHAEQRRTSERARYAAKREEIREKQNAHRKAHPNEARAASILKYQRNKPYYFERAARRRALKLSTQVEKIDFKQILRDSKGLCGICKNPLDLFGIDFDHKIPLSRGGTHTRENIQATHSYCNRAKGAKVG